ncbi:hypothetical protein AAG906_007820 [Vitis piasezkii]
MDGMQNDLSQKIDNIQYSISRLTNLNTLNEKRKFPLNQAKIQKVFMKLKPKMGVFKVEGGQSCDHLEEQDEELMSRTTLVKESNNQEEKSGKKMNLNQALKKILRQVKVNIPLLDMIKQVPTYAKFLKDLCTVKRGLIVTKKAFLTEQVSAIIQCKSPVKYKDPGCPTISINIGGTHVEKALLDLGASVNLLPYSVYKQLGLGELKPTAITLSLADRNGVMQLTFGNMTLELNIFHLCKRHLHPEEEEGFEEVCLINTLVEEHCDKNLEESLNESLGVLEEGLPEPSDVLAIMSPWRRREEILPLFNEEDSKGAAREDPPKLVLKPLPIDLKYAYLEENEKCPVVVSSTLTSDQEDSLWESSKMQKVIGWKIYDLKGLALWYVITTQKCYFVACN